MELVQKHNLSQAIVKVMKENGLTVGEALEVIELAKATVEAAGKGTKL